jgi:hypothetical protein
LENGEMARPQRARRRGKAGRSMMTML